jgi:hypothetical protein
MDREPTHVVDPQEASMGDVVFKPRRKSLSIYVRARTDRTVRTNCEMALRIVHLCPVFYSVNARKNIKYNKIHTYINTYTH